MGGSFFIVNALADHIGIVGRKHEFIGILWTGVGLLWLELRGRVLEVDCIGLG